MKTFLLLTLILLYSCDNSENSNNSLYGKWIQVKSITTTTEGSDESTNVTLYDPLSDDYKSASIILISRSEYITYSDDISGDYFEDKSFFNTKENLDFDFEDKQLILKSSFTVNSSIVIETVSYFEKYEGEIPPSSWLK